MHSGLEPADLAGLLRWARRKLDLSQRDLAAAIGATKARVARLESGADTCPSLGVLVDSLRLAGVALAAVDGDGETVEPLRADGAHDRAGRRLPAHLDPWPVERWEYPAGYHSRYDRPSPEFGFHRRAVRDDLREHNGITKDHLPHSVAAQYRRLPPLRLSTSIWDDVEECACGPECVSFCAPECECQCEPRRESTI